MNTFLRIAKGSGMIKSMKRAISVTRSRKTWSLAYQYDGRRAERPVHAYQGVVERHGGWC